MIVVDANILLYAHNHRSPHHERAWGWLDRALSGTESIGFAWSVVTAFLRIATNHRIFERPLTVDEAATAVDSWFASAAAVPLVPGPGHWTILRGLLKGGRAAGNLVPDAHLAALAIEHGAILLSADRDFARFPGLDFKPFEA